VKIFLQGLDHRYAVEQMLFTLYPAERAEYTVLSPGEDGIIFRLHRGDRFTTITCRITKEGISYLGRTSMRNDAMSSEILEDRYIQRMIKTAFYRAALRSGLERPEWGKLTGVRPVKLMTEELQITGDPESAKTRFIRDFDVSPERAELCLDSALATEAVRSRLQEKDVCLYVGIPFCPSRCDYCSFVSQSVEKSMQLIPPFLEALREEMTALSESVTQSGLRIISIYFGGGTPTTLSAVQLDTLMCDLEEYFDLSNVMEYTIEAGRPDTITKDKLDVFQRHGVTRVSVNPQTMSDDVLTAIGRKHSSQDTIDAFSLVRQVGNFDINMDLIAGLSSDCVKSFQDSIDSVIHLHPENITVHTLSLKKGARLRKEKLTIPDALQVRQMLAYSVTALKEAGYRPYYLYRQKFMSGGFENVGWTLPGHKNIYNVCIMEELCSILALGGGGSTKLIAPGDGKNIRLMAPKYSYEYISHISKVCSDKIKIKEFYDGLSVRGNQS